MKLYPTRLEIADDGQLVVQWNDGVRTSYQVSTLREACPCATCREKRMQPPPPATSLPVLSAAEAQPLRIVEMKPVGNYAYAIRFSDGHDTGIYTLEFLRELAQPTGR